MAPAPPSYAEASGETVDVVIVGAGISGINAAYRLTEKLPGSTYTILEARSGMGGTWDLFRYPGIRSDSDLHTFGFQWRPWAAEQDIAQGDAIRRYIKESAREAGIEQHIRYNHRVTKANWDSAAQEWTVDCDVVTGTAGTGEPVRRTSVRGRWYLLCTGYYDYQQPLSTVIPGLDNFKGQVLHPQFWPEDLDYAGKRIAIVGSGATAITLLPVLAETAARVTMVQRSPTYILSRPAVAPAGRFLHRFAPAPVAHRLLRWLNLILPHLFFLFCRRWPRAARVIMRRRTSRELPANMRHDPHFVPSYNPWEQRLCVCPDSDFFESLRSGKGELVTGQIEKVTKDGIQVRGASTDDPSSTRDSKTFVPADIIITATGLKMQIMGGAKMAVDGKDIDIPSKFLWKGLMIQDVPNASITMGYTNASWTLGADATILQVCRILKEMRRNGNTHVIPHMSATDASNINEAPLLNLSSTYVKKGMSVLPKAGDISPWQTKSSYLWDIMVAQYGNLRRGLQYL